ncbi:hypothetical protein ABBQ38_004697 [Trebouxia sp. C0009 RCD-2024]
MSQHAASDAGGYGSQGRLSRSPTDPQGQVSRMAAASEAVWHGAVQRAVVRTDNLVVPQPSGGRRATQAVVTIAQGSASPASRSIVPSSGMPRGAAIAAGPQTDFFHPPASRVDARCQNSLSLEPDDRVADTDDALRQAGWAALHDPFITLSAERRAELAAEHDQPPSAGGLPEQQAEKPAQTVGQTLSELAMELQRGLTHGRQLEAEVEKVKEQVDKVKEQVDKVADRLKGHNDGLERFKNQVEEMAAADKTPQW